MADIKYVLLYCYNLMKNTTLVFDPVWFSVLTYFVAVPALAIIIWAFGKFILDK